MMPRVACITMAHWISSPSSSNAVATTIPVTAAMKKQQATRHGDGTRMSWITKLSYVEIVKRKCASGNIWKVATGVRSATALLILNVRFIMIPILILKIFN